MKAVAVFQAERRFAIIDHPGPHIETPHQVKLRMLDVGTCGTDNWIVAFDYGTPPEGAPYLNIGHESLGEVVEAGSAVTRLKAGDLAVPTCAVPAAIRGVWRATPAGRISATQAGSRSAELSNATGTRASSWSTTSIISILCRGVYAISAYS
jgi:threonine dehydrogenase-like Zn-dependent dehydrogenase